MILTKTKKPISILIVSLIAVIFGFITIKSGGSTLFIDGVARENAGNYVPFVLWFNFIAGFAYVFAGLGLFMQQQWAGWLSVTIAISTILVFILFGLHVFNDGAYENRTVAAMSVRGSVWALIAIFAYKKIIR